MADREDLEAAQARAAADRELERRLSAVAERQAADPVASSLAADSAANQALAIVKTRPDTAPAMPALAGVLVGTVVGVAGLAGGVGVVACLGFAVIGACLHRLFAAS